MITRIAVALAVVLLVAACGGSSNKRLSHAQFVAKVDKLCTDATKKVGQIPQAAGNQNHQIERFVYHLEQIQSQFLAEARKLSPPVKDEPLWNKALVYNKMLLATWRRIQAAAARGDAKAARTIYQHLQAIALNPYYKRLGMKGC